MYVDTFPCRLIPVAPSLRLSIRIGEARLSVDSERPTHIKVVGHKRPTQHLQICPRRPSHHSALNDGLILQAGAAWCMSRSDCWISLSLQKVGSVAMFMQSHAAVRMAD